MMKTSIRLAFDSLSIPRSSVDGTVQKNPRSGKFHWLKPLLVLCCLTSAVSAATSGDFDYTNDGGSITITGYTGSGGAVVESLVFRWLPGADRWKPINAQISVDYAQTIQKEFLM